MRTRYTLQELRALGVETVGRSAILTVGGKRKEFKAVGGEVVLSQDAASLVPQPAPEPPKKPTKNAGLTLGAD